MSLNAARRTKMVTSFGMLLVNGAVVYAIMNRSTPFGFGDFLCLIVLNAMFLGFFWLAATRMGSQDLKNAVGNQSDDKEPSKHKGANIS
ncbi:MAG TPA: hypothetical protein VF412_00110 [Bdellovibrio sp.]|uniref:hypothetical protein n=1 Tax=Bdellovibrio sp. TaxID=28201 RepID=UPI002F12B957